MVLSLDWEVGGKLVWVANRRMRRGEGRGERWGQGAHSDGTRKGHCWWLEEGSAYAAATPRALEYSLFSNRLSSVVLALMES